MSRREAVEVEPGLPEAVLLVGSLSTGFVVKGPFHRMEEALLVAEELPFAAVLPLVPARGVQREEGEAVVLRGNPSDGWTVQGPYRDFDEAANEADGGDNDEGVVQPTWVMEMQPWEKA